MEPLLLVTVTFENVRSRNRGGRRSHCGDLPWPSDSPRPDELFSEKEAWPGIAPRATLYVLSEHESANPGLHRFLNSLGLCHVLDAVRRMRRATLADEEFLKT